MEEASIGKMIGYGIPGVLTVGMAGMLLKLAATQQATPDASPWMQILSGWMGGIGGLLGAVGALLLLGAMASGMSWLVEWFVITLDSIQRVRSMTPHLLEIQAATRLSEAQAATVPAIGFRAEYDFVAGRDGPAYYLRCPGGSVPREFVDDFLHECGYVKLKAIREYVADTPGREFARLVTAWCVEQRFAVESNGPNPAMWLEPNSKAQAMKWLGLEE